MLIRNARLVALTDAVPGLVDVRVTDGVVAELGAGLSAGAGETSYDADGGWLMPGLWDQHVHLAQWTLSSARLDLAACAVERGGRRAGARAAGGVAGPAGDRVGPPPDGVGRQPGRVGPRRDRDRPADRADRRRRPPRLAQHHRAAHAGAADPRERGQRGRVVHGLRPALDRPRQRRHRPGRLPPHDGGRRGARRGRPRGLRVQRRGRRLGGAVGRGCGPHPGAPRVLRRRPRRRALPRAALGRPARRRPAADDGAAQDHQRRLAQHPHGLVLRAVRREGGARRRGRPAQPDPRGAAAAARAVPQPAASRSPCTRSATGRSPRRWPPSRRPAPAAASSTSSSPPARTYVGWPGSASAPASSRPTCSTTAT